MSIINRWEVLKDLVKADYGEYKEFYVNWKEKPGKDAFLCSEGTNAKFGPIKEGECKKQSSTLKGLMRTEGIVATSVYSGYEASSQVSVTQSTQFGTGLTIAVAVEFFSVAIGTAVSISTTITNTKSTSERKTSNSAVMSTIRMKPDIGKQCSLTIHMESCSFTSDGKVPILATGYVWFELNRKIKGRRIVAYKIQDVLTEKQRSVEIPLTVSINTKAHGDFESNCECFDDECFKLKAELVSAIKLNFTRIAPGMYILLL